MPNDEKTAPRAGGAADRIKKLVNANFDNDIDLGIAIDYQESQASDGNKN